MVYRGECTQYSVRNTLQFFTIQLGYLTGGLLVDKLFEPAMSNQSQGGIMNALFGLGKGSGAALSLTVNFRYFALTIEKENKFPSLGLKLQSSVVFLCNLLHTFKPQAMSLLVLLGCRRKFLS